MFVLQPDKQYSTKRGVNLLIHFSALMFKDALGHGNPQTPKPMKVSVLEKIIKMKCKPEPDFCNITSQRWNNAKKPLSSPKGAEQDSSWQNMMCFHSCMGSKTAPISSQLLRHPASELQDPSIKTGIKFIVFKPHLTHAACPQQHVWAHTTSFPQGKQTNACGPCAQGTALCHRTNEAWPSATGWQVASRN